MINFTAWGDLRTFLQDPKPDRRQLLLAVPAFYKAFGDPHISNEELVSIIRWAHEKARVVFKTLLVETPLPLALREDLDDDHGDWKKVCSALFMVPMLLSVWLADGLLLQYATDSTSTSISEDSY